MNRRIWVALLIAGALLVSVENESKGQERSVTPPVFVPNDLIAGVPQNEWSKRWWHWMASFDRHDSPATDSTGAKCAAGRQGNVWFLAGASGTAPVRRTCEMPFGVTLFVPVLSHVAMPTADSSCEALVAAAKQATDNPLNMLLFVDDMPVAGLKQYRQPSGGCFELRSRGDLPKRVATDGYYVMVRPLTPGPHTLRWSGTLPAQRQAVMYEITITAEPLEEKN